MYNGIRVCRSAHERDMVSPLAQGIFSPRKQDMASPQHKEPIKGIYIYIRYILHDIKQTNNFTIILKDVKNDALIS